MSNGERQMSSPDSGSLVNAAPVEVEHYGLQLLRLAAHIDRMNDCAHPLSHPEKGSPNHCPHCEALMMCLQTDLANALRYLRRGQYFSPSKTRRHIGLHGPHGA